LFCFTPLNFHSDTAIHTLLREGWGTSHSNFAVGTLTSLDLEILLWADSVDAVCTVKIRLLDRNQKLFLSGVSNIQMILELVGGEKQLLAVLSF
jgi:hypothetical protein